MTTIMKGKEVAIALKEKIKAGVAELKEKGKVTSFDKLLLKKLPEKYHQKGTLYQKVMAITCYIASLTDSKAVELHLKTASSSKNI